MLSFFARLACATAVASLLVACAPPPTTYRYTGLVPTVRPIAWDGRTPDGGSCRSTGPSTTE